MNLFDGDCGNDFHFYEDWGNDFDGFLQFLDLYPETLDDDPRNPYVGDIPEVGWTMSSGHRTTKIMK